MKGTFLSFTMCCIFIAANFAFKNLSGGSIKATVTPVTAAGQVWALSSKDTLKGSFAQGVLSLPNVTAGSYKLIIDAAEPYKDVVKEGVMVMDGQTTDLGQIDLQK